MSLRFEQPWWLLLALLSIPLALAALRWLHAMSRARAWSVVLTRTVLLTLIAAMLAGASSVRRTDRLAVIAVVDISASVRTLADFGATPEGRPIGGVEALRAFLRDATATIRPDDLFAVVAFDAGALAVAAPRAGGWDVSDIPLDVSIGEGTNIERALDFAAALLPPDASGRIVLISDGVETAGDALAAASTLAGLGAPVDVAPITYRVTREAMVEFVDAPPQAARDATVTVRVGLRATHAMEGTLYLRREGVLVDVSDGAGGLGRRVTLREGINVELLRVELDAQPIHRFEAVFEPDDPADDTLAANNRGEAFTVAPGAGAVLVLDGVSGGDPDGAGSALPRALRRAGLDVRIDHPEAAPTDLLTLQGYDLVILQNVAADELPRITQELLPDYVAELGGGLVMTGGRKSFGAGGWKASPVEALLPVTLDLPERLVVPNAAIMIVLDSSGSMRRPVMGGSRSQQDIANDAAAMAIELLDKQDIIGVMEFSDTHSDVVPLGPNTDADRAGDRVRRITPGGGTNMYPAIAEAGRRLQSVDAHVKHVIVLGDGVSTGNPDDGVLAARQMREQGITVSTIAVGDAADTRTLALIAAAGGGAFHEVIDPYALPRIFLREVRVVRQPLVRETPFEPRLRRTGSALTEGLSAPIPALGGLVLTQARSDPRVLLAMDTPTDEPLLAHWSVGLGRVAAFTSDAHAMWARRWLDWEGYQTLWTQTARTIARPAGRRLFDLAIEAEGDELRLRMEALDEQGRPMDLLTVPGFVYTPSGERLNVRLAQTGPGVYEGRIDAREGGAYIAGLTPRQGDQALAPVIGGVARATSPELRRLRSDAGVLRAIAERTGGRVLDLTKPQEADLFTRDLMAPARAATPLWRTLLVWCLVVYLLDIATRRVAWDRMFGPEFAQELRRLAQDRPGEMPASRALERVRVRRQSATAQAPEPGVKGARPRIPLAPQRAAGTRPVAPTPSAAADDDAARTQADAGEGRSASLLDAKRRVRERYEQQDEQNR